MSASLQEPPFASGEKSANREAKRKAEDQTAIAGLWFWFGGFGLFVVGLWGRLQYGDIFDDTHWLPFAVELRIDKDGRTVTSFTSPRAYYLPEND